MNLVYTQLRHEAERWELKHRLAYYFMRDWVEAETGSTHSRDGRYSQEDIRGAWDALISASAVAYHAGRLNDYSEKDWR